MSYGPVKDEWALELAELAIVIESTVGLVDSWPAITACKHKHRFCGYRAHIADK
jgi:hypothetical protein